MGLPKGRTNNTSGRPKGTPNKLTTEIREKFTQLIEANINNLQSDIDKLEPKERLRIIIELSKFVLPTLKATELSTDTDSIEPIIFTFG